MKKHFLLFLLIVLFSADTTAQFTLEKFTGESLIPLDGMRIKSMTNLTLKTYEEKLNGIAIKLEVIADKDGKIMRHAISNNGKDAKIKKQLFDYLFAELTKMFGKPERDESFEGTRNCIFKGKDKSYSFTLGHSPFQTILTMIKI